jgi:hypothetical protein
MHLRMHFRCIHQCNQQQELHHSMPLYAYIIHVRIFYEPKYSNRMWGDDPSFSPLRCSAHWNLTVRLYDMQQAVSAIDAMQSW